VRQRACTQLCQAGPHLEVGVDCSQGIQLIPQDDVLYRAGGIDEANLSPVAGVGEHLLQQLVHGRNASASSQHAHCSPLVGLICKLLEGALHVQLVAWAQVAKGPEGEVGRGREERQRQKEMCKEERGRAERPMGQAEHLSALLPAGAKLLLAALCSKPLPRACPQAHLLMLP
jgi:hypothetical protein